MFVLIFSGGFRAQKPSCPGACHGLCQPALDLPAEKTAHLKPGGGHMMRMDLNAPLARDSTVPLVFKDAAFC